MYNSVKSTFEQDCRDLLYLHWQQVLLFFAALIFDAFSTAHAMRYRGTSAELHPLVRLYSYAFGPLAGPLFGACFKAAAGIIVASYFIRLAKFIFTAAAIIAFLAACYNMWAFELYLAGILPSLPF